MNLTPLSVCINYKYKILLVILNEYKKYYYEFR